MLIGAIGCNLAWGIIDAAFYLISCLTEEGRQALLFRNVQESSDPAQAHRQSPRPFRLDSLRRCCPRTSIAFTSI
jgi:hypothetical protein